MTLQDAVDTWVSELKVAGVTNDWADRCRGYVHEAVGACEGDKLSDLTRTSALRWVEGLRVQHKGGTIANRVSALRQFSAWLHSTGRLSVDPLGGLRVRVEQAGEGTRAFLTHEVAAIHGAALEYAARPKVKLWFAPHMVLLASYTALRWSEMGGIRVRDVYLDAGTPILVVPPTVAKNRVRQLVPVHECLAPALAEMIARAKGNMDATIIPRHPEPRFLDKLMEGGGVTKHDARGRTAGWHSFRKWFDTELCRARVDARMVSRLMRHGTEALSELRYTDFTNAELAEAVRNLPAIPVISPHRQIFPRPRGKGLDSGDEIADAQGAEVAMNTYQHIPATDESPCEDAGRLQQSPVVARGGLATGRMSPASREPGMTPRGFEPVDSLAPAAGFMDPTAALDRLLDDSIRALRVLRGGLSGARYGNSHDQGPRGPGR